MTQLTFKLFTDSWASSAVSAPRLHQFALCRMPAGGLQGSTALAALTQALCQLHQHTKCWGWRPWSIFADIFCILLFALRLLQVAFDSNFTMLLHHRLPPWQRTGCLPLHAAGGSSPFGGFRCATICNELRATKALLRSPPMLKRPFHYNFHASRQTENYPHICFFASETSNINFFNFSGCAPGAQNPLFC